MTDPTDVTLLSCPFCGGQATKQEDHWRDGNLCGGAPFCKKCGAQMPRYWPQRETAEAIAAWNTRTPAAATDGLVAENARLRGALTGMVEEYDQQTRYGSPMAKAANPRVQAARAAIAAMSFKD